MGINPNYAVQGGTYPAMGGLPSQGMSMYSGGMAMQATPPGADMFYRAPTPPGSPGTTFAPPPQQQPTVLGPTHAPIGGYAGNPPPMPATLMPGMEAMTGPGIGPMTAPPPGGPAGMALRPEDIAMLQAMTQNPQIAQQVFQQMGIPPEAGQQILAALSRGEIPGMSPGMMAGMPTGPMGPMGPGGQGDSGGRFQPAPGGGYRDTQPGKSVPKRGVFGFIRDHILLIVGGLVTAFILFKMKGRSASAAVPTP